MISFIFQIWGCQFTFFGNKSLTTSYTPCKNSLWESLQQYNRSGRRRGWNLSPTHWSSDNLYSEGICGCTDKTSARRHGKANCLEGKSTGDCQRGLRGRIKSQECEKQYKLSSDKLQVTLQLSLFKGVVPGWWAKAGYRVNKCGLDHRVVFLRKRMRNRLYSPNASLHPGVKMGASELSWKHYEMEGDNLWWTGILSRGV